MLLRNVKSMDSPYIPAERKEKWIKLKPAYIEGATEDLDLLIVGTKTPCVRSDLLFFDILWVVLCWHYICISQVDIGERV